MRWPGKDVTSCQFADKKVEPVEGECLFAIDLLHAGGPVVLSREKSGRSETVSLMVGKSPYPTERVTTQKKYVELKPRDLERVKREQKILAEVFSKVTPPQFSFPISSPLLDAPRGRNFGVKRIFNGQERQPHGGVDYGVPTGTAVLAAEAGRVVLVADHFMPGRIVVVDHGGGFFSTYIHLSQVLVKEGASVTRGQKLALSGATGRVSGPHLHFGVRWQGARINPEQLVTPVEKWPALEESPGRE